MTSLLSVRNLRINLAMHQGTLHAVRSVDLSLDRGETLCLVGESGCGKSLTGHSLVGLLPRNAVRQATEMRFDGIDLLRATKRQLRDVRGSRISMIFQEPMTSLNPAYTIGNQLVEALTCHKDVSAGFAKKRAIELLERVGIQSAAERLSSYPHQLSGGLRQRVMIAMALMCEPDLIIADEPTTALDVTTQAQILSLLVDLQKEFGMALLLITHDLAVVAQMASRVSVMYAGEVVESGHVFEIFDNPAHPYTQALLDCVPHAGHKQQGQPLNTIPGLVPVLFNEIEGCAFKSRCARSVGDACAAEIPIRKTSVSHRFKCIHTLP